MTTNVVKSPTNGKGITEFWLTVTYFSPPDPCGPGDQLLTLVKCSEINVVGGGGVLGAPL